MTRSNSALHFLWPSSSHRGRSCLAEQNRLVVRARSNSAWLILQFAARFELRHWACLLHKLVIGLILTWTYSCNCFLRSFFSDFHLFRALWRDWVVRAWTVVCINFTFESLLLRKLNRFASILFFRTVLSRANSMRDFLQSLDTNRLFSTTFAKATASVVRPRTWLFIANKCRSLGTQFKHRCF